MTKQIIPVIITPEELRKRHKAFWSEVNRVAILRRRLLTDKNALTRRVEFYFDRGIYSPPTLVLPDYPVYPLKCHNMTCGGKGRRSGKPCESKEIYPNGRCKWHGGASTGPKTKEGKTKSSFNLPQPKVIGC